MVSHSFKKNLILYAVLFPVVILTFNSCQQYEYVSMLPGTVTIRLRSYYTQFDTSFSDNNFTIKVTGISAIRSDGILANIYEDVKSIGPTPDIYNLLGRDAYDSTIVIGQYPLPPADYIGLILLIEPGPQVILDGYRNIPVDKQPVPLYTATVPVMQPFRVVEARETRLILTADLDVTLTKQAYTFLYVPSYFISSQSIY